MRLIRVRGGWALECSRHAVDGETLCENPGVPDRGLVPGHHDRAVDRQTEFGAEPHTPSSDTVVLLVCPDQLEPS